MNGVWGLFGRGISVGVLRLTLDLIHQRPEVVHVFEAAVDAGKTDVGYWRRFGGPKNSSARVAATLAMCTAPAAPA